MDKYIYIKLPPSGLGNLLWIWAKGYVFAKEKNCTNKILRPKWKHLHLKRYLLKKEDKRNYNDFFKEDIYINGLKRVGLVTLCKLLGGRKDKYFKVFEELGDFTDLINKHNIVKEELIRIIKPIHLGKIKNIGQSIAIHIRRGDFKSSQKREIEPGETNVQTPIQWFVDALSYVRKRLNNDVPAIVFTDGNRKELRDILSLKNIRLESSENALVSLLSMSTARLLIGSRSSFSLWASYLGQVPSIYCKGGRPWHEDIVFDKDGNGGYELEWDEEITIPTYFQNTI